MMFGSVLEVEAALLPVLQADPVLAGWRTEILALPGFNDDAWKTLFPRFPALGTYCARGEFRRDNLSAALLEVAPLALLAAGRNLRHPAQAVWGDDELPGCLAVLDRARVLVEGWRPGGNLEHITPLSWRLAWCNSQAAVAVLEIEVAINRPLIPTSAEVDAYGSTYP
ncbi:MAG: hypothetical protein KQJ78_11040 [Deltaproteobacteria bacterium]|nr:hypothetical protein [Deltaproteobacteria bacterium]